MPDTPIEFIDKPEAGNPRPFSRVTKAGGMVYVSGHSAPHDPQAGVFRGASAQEETRNALGHIKALLERAGSSMERVVQVTMLITDPSDYHEINREYVTHFPNGLPARHTARFGVPTQARVGFACVALASETS